MKKTLTTIAFVAGVTVSLMAQTTWQPHSLVSEYWPNNDVKSYGGKLYVASNDGLFSSSDNGNTWIDLTSGFSGYSDLVEIQFTNAGNIFVRKNSYGIVRSLDGGSTWEYDTTGVGNNYGTSLLYYDGTSDQVFLGIGFPKYKLYYQSPADANWTEVTALPSGLNNFTPVQMTRKGSKLFVIDIYKRVLESSDNGFTWIQKSGTGLVSAESQVGPSRFLSIGNDLYYGIGGVWKSTDDGDNWTQIDQGFANADTRCLYYDGSTLYSSTYGGGTTYKSTDSGATWGDMGGSGSWFFKAMAMHNGSLYGVVHSKDSIYVHGSGTTGFSESVSNDNISIYPNPANDFITVANATIGSTINITDITGKEIYNSVINADKTAISTSNLINGIYIIQVTKNGVIVNKKLVINKQVIDY